MPGDLLPLFPLHVVLFPSMPLPLHVFEERYVRMVMHCIRNDTPFGIALIREGEEVGGPAVPMRVGTRARIRAVEPTADGGMRLLVVGTERFVLQEVEPSEEPYLVGRVEALRDGEIPAEALQPLVREVRELFAEYFKAIIQNAGVEMPEYELPDDPEELSFVIAALLQADNDQRQEFLEMTDTRTRLTLQCEMLRAQTDRFHGIAERQMVELSPLEHAPAAELFSRN